jgi:hypothetical protein
LKTETRTRVKNPIVLFTLAFLSVSFTYMPSEQTISKTNAVAFSHPALPDSSFSVTINDASIKYSAINLQQYGLSEEAFAYAYKGYHRLLDKKMIDRPDFITICDFSQSSNQKRLYVIDLTNNKLVMNTYVAHGHNSGAEYATKFSNRPESLQTSLGFYITRDTYIGEHGLALKIDGVEAGFNDNAMKRNIVIHGATYIDDAWLRHSTYMGRSFGCPAIPQKEISTVINTIKNGTCLFIYHPQKQYLLGSKILNG